MTTNPYMCLPHAITQIIKETAIDWTFTVAYNTTMTTSPGGLPLRGGQFMQVSIPGVGEAPISISDFTDHTLTMTIRRVGRLTDALFNLSVGDPLYIRGPYGNGFDLESLIGKHAVIIAGGTGVAPVRRVIKAITSGLIKTQSTRIVAGFKSPEDILFKDDLTALSPDQLTLTIDKPAPNWTQTVGLVTDHIPSLNKIDPLEAMALVVGPPMMMKFTTLALLKEGYLPENIIVSFERNMSCALGKCGHCKIDETYVCLEGPVFSYPQAAKLLD